MCCRNQHGVRREPPALAVIPFLLANVPYTPHEPDSLVPIDGAVSPLCKARVEASHCPKTPVRGPRTRFGLRTACAYAMEIIILLQKLSTPPVRC